MESLIEFKYYSQSNNRARDRRSAQFIDFQHYLCISQSNRRAKVHLLVVNVKFSDKEECLPPVNFGCGTVGTTLVYGVKPLDAKRSAVPTAMSVKFSDTRQCRASPERTTQNLRHADGSLDENMLESYAYIGDVVAWSIDCQRRLNICQVPPVRKLV